MSKKILFVSVVQGDLSRCEVASEFFGGAVAHFKWAEKCKAF